MPWHASVDDDDDAGSGRAEELKKEAAAKSRSEKAIVKILKFYVRICCKSVLQDVAAAKDAKLCLKARPLLSELLSDGHNYVAALIDNAVQQSAV